MIFLYTFLLLLLVVVRFLIARRVAALEKKYARAASAAGKLLNEPVFKPGSCKLDPALVARRQYQLGQLVERRERLEDKWYAWRKFHEKYGRCVAAVQGWKGKKLPYTFGVLDVSFVLYLIDHFSIGEYLNAHTLLQLVTSLVAQ
jgi:hypothetical protein